MSRSTPPIAEPVASGEEETPLLLRPVFVALLATAFVGLAALYALFAFWFGSSFSLQPGPLRDWVNDRGPLAPAFFIALMAVAVLFAAIPNLPILIAAGLVWGPVLGSIYSVAGLMLGSIMAFYSSRLVGRRHLRRFVGERMARRLDDASHSFGGRLVFWARLFPATNFDWISFAAGLTAIRFRTFFVYSLLGMTPPTILSVAAGDSLTRDIRLTFLLAGVWVGGVVAGGLYIWWRRSRRRANAAAI